MSLIIEGSDNLGKTILAKKLVRYVIDHGNYPVMYSWMTRPNEATFDFFTSYKMMLNSYTVQDRFHLGALAYHNNRISKRHLEYIEQWIENRGGFVVLLYANDEDWYKHHIARDDRGNLLANDALCKANSVFKKMAIGKHRLHPIIKYVFDISNERFVDDRCVQTIAEDWMRKRRESMKTILG
jgi:archaellum biogenesis ATPase FlaH